MVAAQSSRSPLEADRERLAALPAAITAAGKARDERKLIAQAGFNKWLDVTEKESVPLELPTNGLLVNLPLNEGSGNTGYKSNCRRGTR